MAYTTIDDPSAHFQTTLYTGNGGTISITNGGNSDLKPDWVWIKNRTQYQHQAYDTNRGATKKFLVSNDDAESTDTNALTAFNTDGFSTGTNVGVNQNSTGHVAWQWKANGGTTASNTDGSLTSTVQANTTAGFSIITYTAADSDEVIGHGLGVKPDIIIIKRRDADSAPWITFFPNLLTTNKQVYLNQTSALDTNNVKEVGASTFRVYGWEDVAVANGTYVAYCFAAKQGYSKIGTYVGNGNADGPFVYTGFQPAFLLMKEISSAGGNWVNFDNKRDVDNVLIHRLHPNTTAGDNTSRNYIDFYSNGFKMRNTDADHNQSGETMVYMAFAEHPFVTSTGIPTTAR